MNKPMIKDINDQVKAWESARVSLDQQRAKVEAWLQNAEPYVVVWARSIGEISNITEKAEALNLFFKLAVEKLSAEDRAGFKEVLIKELRIKTSQWTERMKVISDKLKSGEDEDLPEVETLGGWYPDDETGNCGYLVEVFMNQRTNKLEFAYARIEDMEKNVRTVGTATEIVLGKRKLVPPLSDDNLFGENPAVKLPTGLGELRSSRDLININAKYYEKYFYLEEKSRYKFCGQYALFTWVHDSFEALNFLRARGGSGSGKSDLMYLVGLTSYRFAVTLAISSNASYKGIAKVYKATVMIDEAENMMKKDDGTMEAFLKGRAMKRFANVMNMMETMTPNGKVFVPSTTNVYGPTLITMYGGFKDPGIENRCISFELSQVDSLTLDRNDMEPGFYPPELEDEAAEIRNLCLRWRLENWKKRIELTPEQRKQHKLMDPLVSPRVNQVLRPMKVLAVLQNDLEMLYELRLIGQANYEDEMIKRAGSFEAMILRAYIGAFSMEGYADKVKSGKFGKYGQMRYVLFKDMAQIANELLDSENLAEGVEDKKKSGIKSKTVGDICRETFRFPVQRTMEGWAVGFDAERAEIGKLRFGLDIEEKRMAEDAPLPSASPQTEEHRLEGEQLSLSDGPVASTFNEETGEWEL